MYLGEFGYTPNISDDFQLSDANYWFPLSYLVEQEVEEGDSVLVATVVQANEPTPNKSQSNCDKFEEEVRKAIGDKKVKLEFQRIVTTKHFGSTTFNSFFKVVADVLKEEDRLYMDITFGMKPYSLAMFIAASYAVSVCEDVDVEYVIYAQKFTGNEKAEKDAPSKIYDITGLFYLNSLANDARTGNRAAMDKLFKNILQE